MPRYKFLNVNLVPHEKSFVIQWSAENIGWGEIQFWNVDGIPHCESECMSRDFVVCALAALARKCVLVGDDKEGDDE